MSYYKTCRKCGANLDPNEKCDCEEKRYHFISKMYYIPKGTRFIQQDDGGIRIECVLQSVVGGTGTEKRRAV